MKGTLTNPLVFCILAFAQWAFADFTQSDSAKALASCPSGSSFIGVTVYGGSVDEARSKARAEIAHSIISIVKSKTSMGTSSDESNGILEESGTFLSASEIESNAAIKGFREIETPKLRNGEYELKGYICRSRRGVSETSVGGKPNVAVGALGEEPHNSNALKGLSTQLTKAIVKNGRYTAIDRSEEILKQLGKEHGYQRGGAVDDRQIKELGLQFGVQYLCIIQSSEVMSHYMLEARLVDVETAVIAGMGSVPSSLRHIDDLMRAADEISLQLLGKPKTPPKLLGKSLWVAVGLDVLGAAAIGFGIYQNGQVASHQKKYNGIKEGRPQGDFDSAYKKVESSQNMRNTGYIAGGVLLLGGVGVHIFF
jgi:hypothetical protein